MISIIIGSLAFSIGGAFMGNSAGFTRLSPSVLVTACFEAVASVAIGLAILGERLTAGQVVGIAIILVELVTLKHG